MGESSAGGRSTQVENEKRPHWHFRIPLLFLCWEAGFRHPPTDEKARPEEA